MVDFAEILNKPAAEIEEPKPYPVGTYLAAITALPEQRTQATKEGDRLIIRYKLKAIAAKDDVDTSQLAEQAELSTWPTFSYDIWVDTPQGEWQLRSFNVDVLGIDDNGKSLGQMLPEGVGKQLLMTLKHDMYTRDGKPQIATRVGSVAAV